MIFSFETWQITLFSLSVGLASTLLILPFGIALAWLFARKEWPLKSVLETIVLLPLVMPPVSTGLILLKIFGRRSPLGHWLYERGVEIVFNWKGVLIAMAVMSFPLLVRSVRTSFAEVNPRLEQIAATLGASALQNFLRHHDSLGLQRHCRRSAAGVFAGARGVRRDDLAGRKYPRGDPDVVSGDL